MNQDETLDSAYRLALLNLHLIHVTAEAIENNPSARDNNLFSSRIKLLAQHANLVLSRCLRSEEGRVRDEEWDEIHGKPYDLALIKHEEWMREQFSQVPPFSAAPQQLSNVAQDSVVGHNEPGALSAHAGVSSASADTPQSDRTGPLVVESTSVGNSGEEDIQANETRRSQTHLILDGTQNDAFDAGGTDTTPTRSTPSDSSSCDLETPASVARGGESPIGEEDGGVPIGEAYGPGIENDALDVGNNEGTPAWSTMRDSSSRSSETSTLVPQANVSSIDNAAGEDPPDDGAYGDPDRTTEADCLEKSHAANTRLCAEVDYEHDYGILSANGLHLCILQGDTQTPFNQSVIDMTLGKCGLKVVEQKGTECARILRPRMEVGALAKEEDVLKAEESASTNYNATSVDGPISGTLIAWEKDKDRSTSHLEDQELLREAAIAASGELKKKKEKSAQPEGEALEDGKKKKKKSGSDWKRDVRLPKPCVSHGSAIGHIIVIIRVWHRITFERLSEKCGLGQGKLISEFKALGEKITGENIGPYSIAKVYEDVLVPATRPDFFLGLTKPERRIVLEMTKLIIKKMALKDWNDEFFVSEAIPMTRTLSSYSKEELEALKTMKILRFFSELKENGKDPTKTAQSRRRRAARMLGCLLHASLVSRALMQFGLSEQGAAKLPHALLCSAPSKYDGNGYDSFMKKDLCDEWVSEDFAKDAWDKAISKMFDNFEEVMEVFRDNHIYVNMTQDITDGTADTRELFASYFKSLDDGTSPNEDVEQVESI